MKSFNEYVNEQRNLRESKDLQDEYQKVFKALLDKYGVKSPAELSDDDKSKFFDDIKNYYTAGKGPTKKGEELTSKG